MSQVVKALQYSEEAHEGQTRTFQGVDYFVHPHSVMKLVNVYDKGYSEDINTLLMAALLHDVVEDTDIALSTIRREFDVYVAQLVEELTSFEVDLEEAGSKKKYLAQSMEEMSDDALFIKLCDRLDNVTDLHFTHKTFERGTWKRLNIFLKTCGKIETWIIGILKLFLEFLERSIMPCR